MRGFSANIPVPSDIECDMEYQYFGHSSVSFSMDLNGLLTYCASLSAKCLIRHLSFKVRHRSRSRLGTLKHIFTCEKI